MSKLNIECMFHLAFGKQKTAYAYTCCEPC